MNPLESRLHDWPAHWPRAVVVHGAAEVDRACAPGLPVVLLSASGAALFAGVGFWRALMEQARARHGDLIVADVLDCADAPGLALAALRLGQRALVLDPACPGYAAVVAIATRVNAKLLITRDRTESVR